ncbi:MAG: hypothetical protein GXP31_10805 [Kiritimatiellaeota bacterium]|nr:hypothetical protein [Kiritimatiellota bacterium]
MDTDPFGFRYRPRQRCLVWALTVAWTATSVGATTPAARTLMRISDRVNLSRYALTDCKAAVVQTPTGAALRLRFGHQMKWPNLRFLPDALGYRTDWSGFAFLALLVSNPTDTVVKVNIRIDSEAVKDRGRQGGVPVAPGQTVRLLMPIVDPQAIVGMRGQPPLPMFNRERDVLISHSRVALDPARITQWQIFMGRPNQNHTILVHQIELVPPSKRTKKAFVDRFGQYNGADWLGKLHDEAEFAARVRAEEKDFRANPPFADRDRFGGWKEGPQLEATGRFRVRKLDEKWWLVDPEGRLFWSSGITCVRFNSATVVTGRESCFQGLPETGDPLARFYSKRGKKRLYDFFQANAFRKYGNEFYKCFYEATMKRLRSWGFNTLGCWSSPDAWRARKVPYTLPINVRRVPMFVAASHTKAGLLKKKWFPDPFDPKFRVELERALTAQSEFKNDPWLLGVFIHNELPWTLGVPWRHTDRTPTGIAVLCLQKNDGSLRAKRVLLERLKTRYGAIAGLNRKWGTEFAGWEAMAAPFELTETQRKNALDDLAELDKLIAEQYFRVCREAMDKQMPGVLYLGCRFSGMYDRHFVEIAKKYCDVVSFNIYAERPSDRTADELAVELDFPVIIGEFHFGALDRGMFDPGLRRAKDQAERAGKYAAYVREAAAAAWCVGAHWFQYLDQPLTGRPDGENYNIGFVDATDDPYPEMRQAAREVHQDLYTTRMRK